MKTCKTFLQSLNLIAFTAFTALMLAGCSTVEKSTSQPSAAAPTGTSQTPAPIRIKTGVSQGFTDNSGNVWLSDRGFADGETDERPEVTIQGATDQRIYQAERYSMTHFTQPVPNGNYTVKLHFCETFDGITGPGQRVFSFNVAGHDFKDFDVWVKAGGALHAYVVTVPVEVTNGKVEISFTPNIENPEINGIEILPAQ